MGFWGKGGAERERLRTNPLSARWDLLILLPEQQSSFSHAAVFWSPTPANQQHLFPPPPTPVRRLGQKWWTIKRQDDMCGEGPIGHPCFWLLLRQQAREWTRRQQSSGLDKHVAYSRELLEALLWHTHHTLFFFGGSFSTSERESERAASQFQKSRAIHTEPRSYLPTSYNDLKITRLVDEQMRVTETHWLQRHSVRLNDRDRVTLPERWVCLSAPFSFLCIPKQSDTWINKSDLVVRDQTK